MNSDQISLIIKRIKSNYPNYEMTKDMVNEWKEELSNFYWEDVNNNITKYLKSESADRFPKVYRLTRGIPTIKQQEEQYEEYKVECPQCRRFINSKEYSKHFERCSSINYILRQIKRFNMNNMDKSFLWKLSDEEFDERYKKFLRKVQELTSDPMEKKRIEFIFNPPTQEEAQQFLKGNK